MDIIIHFITGSSCSKLIGYDLSCLCCPLGYSVAATALQMKNAKRDWPGKVASKRRCTGSSAEADADDNQEEPNAQRNRIFIVHFLVKIKRINQMLSLKKRELV